MVKHKIYAAALLLSSMILSCKGDVAPKESFEIKPIKFTDIAGGYKFEQPEFVYDSEGYMVYVEKLGHTAGALYDYNGDGIDDLLLGEFSGKDDTFLKVYLNEGSNKKPRFSADWSYTKDVEGNNLLIPGY